MGYRYIKFEVTKRRYAGSGYIQLSEIELLNGKGEKFVWPSGTVVTASSTPTSASESPQKLIDGSKSTKYCGYTPGNVTFIIDLGESGSVDLKAYKTWRWYTANDAYDRDPISFSLSVSSDGAAFTEVDSSSDASITTSRCALAYTGSISVPYDSKYLIGDADGKLYTIEDDSLVELEETTPAKALFLSYGLEGVPEGSLLLSLDNPRVYYWHDSDDDPPVIHIAASETPKPQAVITENVYLSHPTIRGVENVTIDADETALFAVSFDDGITWWNYVNDAWAVLSEALSGQTKETIEAISTNAWAEKVRPGGTIRFRFAISGDGYVNNITIHYLN